jgi:hypothetical protein
VKADDLQRAVQYSPDDLVTVWRPVTSYGKTKSSRSTKLLYGWMPHNASFDFLDLAPSILHSNWFWDYIS